MKIADDRIRTEILGCANMASVGNLLSVGGDKFPQLLLRSLLAPLFVMLIQKQFRQLLFSAKPLLSIVLFLQYCNEG